jgi:hypothetical protein
MDPIAPQKTVTKDGQVAPHSHSDKMRSTFLETPSVASKVLVTSLIIVALSMLASLGTTVYQAANASSEQSSVNTSEYQAVFLTNNQTYFGKIKSINSDSITLTNVYYLQSLTPQTTTLTTPTTSTQKPTLVKLGNEVYGPEDSLHISRTQLMHWENIKNDGQVTKAIDSYKSN